jgi:hypothetical protein
MPHNVCGFLDRGAFSNLDNMVSMSAKCEAFWAYELVDITGGPHGHIWSR